MPTNKPELRRAARLRRKSRDPEKYFAGRKEQKRRARDRKRGGPPRQPSLYDSAGWNPEMIAQTTVEQGNRCAICRLPKKLCTDHKHVRPPQPRALLCSSCNSLIGFAKDSPEVCRAAADYLEAWSQTETA